MTSLTEILFEILEIIQDKQLLMDLRSTRINTFKNDMVDLKNIMMN